ncbi:MAG: DUF6530 family protein [Sphaerochaetaceae bacterium]|nr:DUF6530 family protein [Sphaerochaetaceae bacterium]
MEIPTTLKHKPVVVVENYEQIDGKNAYNSDAKGLSLGLAQWNDRGSLDISAKVWRHTGGKWSRQSEEMPLHRVLDLAILIARAKEYFSQAYRYEKYYDPENTRIDRIGLQGDAMSVDIATNNEMLDTDIRLFADALAQEDERISERLQTLVSILERMGYHSIM